MDPQKTWQKILNKIKLEIDTNNFRTWFGNTNLDSIDGERLVISIPHAFLHEQLKVRYLKLIRDCTEQVIGNKLSIDFKVDSSKQKKVSEEDIEEGLFQSQPLTPIQPILNPKFTLENFVVGFSNNIAYAAAQAVAETPGTAYNPLFIYGGTGVGKTHLMIGIGNAVLSKNSQAKVIYCSSEQFMNDYVGALQNHKMGDLRSKYRLAQLLLIDDIQFFSGREATQEEFFHTFNELQGKNSQMVFTSDRPPHEIAKLEDRLRSRFAGGLMVDIQSPDFDTKVAILKAKAATWGSILPDESLKLIATSSDLSIRELEGKLLQIIQTLKIQNLPTTPDNISSYLTKTPTKRSSITHIQVLSTICSYFNLTPKDLTGPRRQKELVLPRHIIMYILSEEMGMTVEKIGQILGGRDHTTVMHGRDKVRLLINNNREVQRIYIEIKSKLSTI